MEKLLLTRKDAAQALSISVDTLDYLREAKKNQIYQYRLARLHFNR